MIRIVHSILAALILHAAPVAPAWHLSGFQHENNSNQQPNFDGARALVYLVKQTDFGPRAPGFPGHSRCLGFLRTELKKYADAVLVQNFPHTLPDGKNVQLTNIVASFNPRSKHRVLLSAHWDTRPWADQDPDPKNRNKPIPGANDGASGVAILLEVARELRAHRTWIGVDIVLFDGEDLGKTGTPGSFSSGAKYFAANMPSGFSPAWGINIDMVGDRNLQIYREQNSERLAPEVQKLVFSTAVKLGIGQFVDSPGDEVTDDHMPLNSAGIPTIDLIDFEYPDESNRFWHTLADTPDKCSAESLAAVGTVLLTVIYSQ